MRTSLSTAAVLAAASLSSSARGHAAPDTYEQIRQQLITRIQGGDTAARLELRAMERPAPVVEPLRQRAMNIADRVLHLRRERRLA